MTAARVYSVRRPHPEGAVYIGRPGHGHRGEWGNPVALGRPCPECRRVHSREDAEAACACYGRILRRDLAALPALAARFDRLGDRDLLCFCAPTEAGLGADDPIRCHGQVMLIVRRERAEARVKTREAEREAAREAERRRDLARAESYRRWKEHAEAQERRRAMEAEGATVEPETPTREPEPEPEPETREPERTEPRRRTRVPQGFLAALMLAGLAGGGR